MEQGLDFLDRAKQGPVALHGRVVVVGGGILLHGWPALGHAVEAYAGTLGDLAGGLVNAAAGAGLGVIAGAVVLAVVSGVQRLRQS